MPSFQFEDVFGLITPLTILVALVSGLIMGFFYHRQMKTGVACMYTTYVAGLAFILTMTFARSYESDIWENWLGVAILYSLFTLTSAIGRKL